MQPKTTHFDFTKLFLLIDIYDLMRAAFDPVEGQHGRGEPSLGRAEPESAKGEQGPAGAELGAP